jgi:hypothetical protein
MLLLWNCSAVLHSWLYKVVVQLTRQRRQTSERCPTERFNLAGPLNVVWSLLHCHVSRLNEIRVLKVRLADMRRELHVLRTGVANVDVLKREVRPPSNHQQTPGTSGRAHKLM